MNELEGWHKLLIHLALNIGPQTSINEDIIEEIKEEPAQEDGAAEGFKELSLGKYMTELPAEGLKLDVENLAKLNSSLVTPAQNANEASGQKSGRDSARSAGGRSKASKSSNTRGKTKEPSSKTPNQAEAQETQAEEAPRAQVPKTEYAFGKAIPQTQIPTE